MNIEVVAIDLETLIQGLGGPEIGWAAFGGTACRVDVQEDLFALGGRHKGILRRLGDGDCSAHHCEDVWVGVCLVVDGDRAVGALEYLLRMFQNCASGRTVRRIKFHPPRSDLNFRLLYGVNSKVSKSSKARDS